MSIFIIFVIITAILVGSLYLVDKLYAKNGLLMLLIVIILISNFIVLKRFPIWNGQSLTMSVLVYPFIFVASSFVANKYGKKEASKFANLTIFANLIFVVIMTVATFTPAAFGNEKNAVDVAFSIIDKSGKVLPGLIGMNICGWIALYSALFISRNAFYLFNQKLKLNFMFSTILASFLADSTDSVIFVVFGLCLVSGFLPWNSAITEIITMIIAKTLVSTINTVLISFKKTDNFDQQESLNLNK